MINILTVLQGGGGQYPYPKEVWSPAGGSNSELYRGRTLTVAKVVGGHDHPTGERIPQLCLVGSYSQHMVYGN